MQLYDIYRHKKNKNIIQIDSFATRMGSYGDMIIVFTRIFNNGGMVGHAPSGCGYGTQEEIEKEYELFIPRERLDEYESLEEIYELAKKESGPIDSFDKEYGFLSNFHNSEVEFEGLTYKNSESAFQSAKVLDIEERKKWCNVSGKRAKALGRRCSLREDWDDVKYDVMLAIVRDKFTRSEKLKKKLLATKDRKLIEGNHWNDTYWGVCEGTGENNLGKILMRVRAEMKA